MTHAGSGPNVKRWNEQRWVLDAVIQTIGVEWDQPRLAYTMYPAGIDAIADFRAVGAKVRKSASVAFGAKARKPFAQIIWEMPMASPIKIGLS